METVRNFNIHEPDDIQQWITVRIFRAKRLIVYFTDVNGK